MEPQFTPVGGEGSKSNGYTFTGGSWGKDAVTVPVPTKPKVLPTQKPNPTPTIQPQQTVADSSQGIEDALGRLKNQLGDGVDKNAIRRATEKRFQTEIDATNQIFRDLIQRTQKQGEFDAGKTRALTASGGIMDSARGQGQMQRQDEENMRQERGVLSQQALAQADIQKRIDEASEGLYNTERGAYLQSAVANLMDSGVSNPTEIVNNLRELGISSPQIAEVLAVQQSLTPAQQEGFNLSEGQARFAYNPQTGQVEMIAQRGKTYAPGSGGGGGGVGGGMTTAVSQGAMNLARQIQAGQATLASVPSAMRAEVATALMQLPSPQVIDVENSIDILNELRNAPGLPKIIGGIEQLRPGWFGKSAQAKNKYQQVKGLLSLEGRQKLKGSGAISDFEARTLEQASSALGRNLSQEAFIAELDKVINILDKRRISLSQQGFVGYEQPSSGNTEVDSILSQFGL